MAPAAARRGVRWFALAWLVIAANAAYESYFLVYYSHVHVMDEIAPWVFKPFRLPLALEDFHFVKTLGFIVAAIYAFLLWSQDRWRRHIACASDVIAVALTRKTWICQWL